MVNRPLNLQIDWNAVFDSMITLMLIIGMGRILSRAITSEKPALLPQTLRKLRFATTPLEVERDTFAEWVETEKIELLQAGGYHRSGRKPTLAVLDGKIYAVVRYGPKIKLLSVRWEDLAEETVREVEERGVKIAGVALLPQVKRKEVIPYRVTVECPICQEVIEAGEPISSRTEALKRHIEKQHSGKPSKATPELLLQSLLGEGGEPIPSQYRDLIGWLSQPLPEYRLSVLPAVVPAEDERKIDAVLKQLKDGVGNIQDSYQFRLFLTTMSRFHDYSIGNLILIAMQKPSATRVAGFNTWKDLGRRVKKGEKGISILAPVIPPKPKPEKKEGEEEEVEIELQPVYFKVVYVFDITQTEGKPLPEFEVPTLTGEANEELFASLLTLMKKRSVQVSFESRPYLDPAVKGQYSPPAQIWVRPEEPRAQQLKTLLHEVAHYYSENVFRIPRADAETIAESVAFTVGAHHGSDTGTRSFPYVALWSKDKKVLEANLAAIRKVSAKVIDALGQTTNEMVGMA